MNKIIHLIPDFLVFAPVIAILLAVIGSIITVTGLNTLKNRKKSSQNMNNDFNDLRDRVQKELKKS